MMIQQGRTEINLRRSSIKEPILNNETRELLSKKQEFYVTV
jgi:hypothetical protein